VSGNVVGVVVDPAMALGVVLLWLCIPGLALAASVSFGWEFPRGYLPAPDHFLLTLARPESQDVLQVPPSVPGACGAGSAATPNLYCATLPGCPADGVYQFSVAAVWADGQASGTVGAAQACVFSHELPCQCLPVAPASQGSPGDVAALLHGGDVGHAVEVALPQPSALPSLKPPPLPTFPVFTPPAPPS
jgi:hypothetical protein